MRILVTDEKPNLIERVEKALKGDIRRVVLRCKTKTAKEFYQLALEMRRVTANNQCQLIINDRLDIALAVKADGVHFPEKSLPATKRPKMLVGKSTHSLESARQAEEEGADYVFFGPVYPTEGKAIPQGLEKLQEVSTTLNIPVFAIGGIDEKREKLCIDCGAAGVAMKRYLL